MKQTAVEWLVSNLPTDFQIELIKRDILTIAKEMEKEQSECICVNVIEMILNESEQGKEINSKEIFEQCYNETFK